MLPLGLGNGGFLFGARCDLMTSLVTACEPA
jgi:hypothetical protein